MAVEAFIDFNAFYLTYTLPILIIIFLISRCCLKNRNWHMVDFLFITNGSFYFILHEIGIKSKGLYNIYIELLIIITTCCLLFLLRALSFIKINNTTSKIVLLFITVMYLSNIITYFLMPSLGEY